MRGIGFRRVALLIVLVAFLVGCASTAVKPVCRHKSVLTALTWNDLMGAEVRIAVGPVNTGLTGLHAQAQAKHNGKWEWLVLDNLGNVDMGPQDFWFEPDTYYTVQDFIDKYWGWL